jgi:hypothetical protein
MSESTLQERIANIRERIAVAARRSGRAAEQVTLIAVSKTHPAESIRAAWDLGVTHFGENRVQEWEGKRGPIESLPAEWHLIGHLQSNKAAKAVRMFHCVDSVDNASLAHRLNRARAEMGIGKKLRVLIEVRVAPEDTKSGVEPADLRPLAETVLTLSNLELRGLMCIPPYIEEPEKVRPYFQRLRAMRDDLQDQLSAKLPVLSMGMSHDFEVAIEEGATEVRVGTALFGTRANSQHPTT